jgi:hypothetical protein
MITCGVLFAYKNSDFIDRNIFIAKIFVVKSNNYIFEPK